MTWSASAPAAASASTAAPHGPLTPGRVAGRPPLFLVREAALLLRPLPPPTSTPSRSWATRSPRWPPTSTRPRTGCSFSSRTFDRRRGWELDGHRSCAHWLAFRTGIDLGAAREKVRTARALDSLPETGASMARGELSFSQVRALTRVATPENEGDLLELARGTTVAQLERMVRGFRRGSRRDEASRERANHEARTLSVFPDEEGMYVVRGRLEPEVAAVLMRAIEAAGDALFRGGARSAAKEGPRTSGRWRTAGAPPRSGGRTRWG